MKLRFNRLLLWLGAGIVLLVIVFVWRRDATPPEKAPSPTTASETVPEATGPVVGGPFTLVDHNGKVVTDADFRGRFMLVYFGYTFCPDVCPTSLTAISDALDLLGADGEKVVPVFISVDAERDTPEYLKEYVAYFHPRLVGLSGTIEQVMAAAKAYRVYFAKVQEEGAEPDDYLMEHSSITYLMGPDGKFRTHFGYGTDPETMARRIREFL